MKQATFLLLALLCLASCSKDNAPAPSSTTSHNTSTTPTDETKYYRQFSFESDFDYNKLNGIFCNDSASMADSGKYYNFFNSALNGYQAQWSVDTNVHIEFAKDSLMTAADTFYWNNDEGFRLRAKSDDVFTVVRSNGARITFRPASDTSVISLEFSGTSNYYYAKIFANSWIDSLQHLKFYYRY